MAKRKPPPPPDLPAGWFCEDQTDLLDLLGDDESTAEDQE